MDALVSFAWLHTCMDNPNVVVVDCRFSLQDGSAGYQAYREHHIPGAVYLDLEKDLSGPVTEHGGRHPLPSWRDLAAKLGQLGVTPTHKVVCYDDQNSCMAARLWWLLRYLGHSETAVLNGNYSKWAKQYPTDTEIPTPVTVSYEAKPVPAMAVSMEYVRTRLRRPNVVLMDARESQRFAGLEEPIDAIAGRIPGSVNYFWRDRLDDEGYWRSKAELQQDFQDLGRDKEIIAYCGSGVSACPNILALEMAGYTNVKLYPGSWSDWISYPDNPRMQDRHPCRRTTPYTMKNSTL